MIEYYSFRNNLSRLHALPLANMNLHMKFEVPGFTYIKDINGAPQFIKNKLCEP